MTRFLHSTKQEPKSPIESDRMYKKNILAAGLSLSLLQLSSKKVNANTVSPSDSSINNKVKSKILLEETVINNEIITSTLPLSAKSISEKTAQAEATSFYNGALSGAVQKVTKEAILHPIDTVRARIVATPISSSTSGTKLNNSYNDNSNATTMVTDNLYEDLYSGIVPALVGGVPAGALFFGVKDYSKKFLKRYGFDRNSATLLSVILTNIPYWVVRSPSEIVKTRQQAGTDSNMTEFVMQEYEKDGLRGVLSNLYSSYTSNYAYATPADMAKFVAYEGVTSSLFNVKEGQKVMGVQAAVAGALAGLASQMVTSPLDVARTRIMTREETTVEFGDNPFLVLQSIAEREGVEALFAGLEPRAVRAIVSGIIQFASYESTQNALRQR